MSGNLTTIMQFDATDRSSHFGTYLPLRALNNSLVLNSICGISAQYLLRMRAKSSSPDIIEFEGIKLPHLTGESVIQYQSTCINLLIDASVNSEEYADGDILSAITILRFHEQNDGEITDPYQRSSRRSAPFIPS